MKHIHDIVRKCQQLSQREADAADLLLLDLEFANIARRMGITTDTVKSYLKQARKKLGVRSRIGLALYWQQYRAHQQNHEG